MVQIISKYLTGWQLKEFIPPAKLRTARAVRIQLNVNVFKEDAGGITKPESLNFIRRFELSPVLFIETFWEELREHTKEMYEVCDMMYGFSNYLHSHEIKFQLEF